LALARPAAAAPDSAVDAQYRLAQRLAAERSPEATAAFEQVITMAPKGMLADDALIGLARVQAPVDWPEDLAGIDAAHAARASASLAKLLESSTESDRADEARYLQALLRLAPLSSRDAGLAKRELIAVAANPKGGRYAGMARYALGVLAEREGAVDRAAGAYARVVLEGSDEDVETRARAGFARTLLQAGSFGEAAVWWQAVVDAGAPEVLRASSLRALAVREIVRQRDPANKWTAVAAPLPSIPTTRGAKLLATAGDGGLVVFDRKNEILQIFDARGAGSPPLAVQGVTALATDSYRRVWVAAGDALLRLEGSRLVSVATLGAFKEPAALAVDASGTAWLADRRGDRVGRVPAGAASASLVRDAKGAGITALAIVRGRLIAAESDAGRLAELPETGPEQSFGPAVRKPAALAVDGAGRLSVLDEKSGTLLRLSPAGEIRDSLDLAAAGVSRALAITATDDGSIRILDGATGSVVVAP
jgi:hypothetical protein